MLGCAVCSINTCSLQNFGQKQKEKKTKHKHKHKHKHNPPTHTQTHATKQINKQTNKQTTTTTKLQCLVCQKRKEAALFKIFPLRKQFWYMFRYDNPEDIFLYHLLDKINMSIVLVLACFQTINHLLLGIFSWIVENWHVLLKVP